MNVRIGLVTAPFEGTVATVEAKDPGSDDVVIRTEYSFLSNGTERHTHLREFPEPPATFPMAMGYQCVGRIEQVGSAVRGFAVGQRVFTRQNKLMGVSNPIGGVHAERVTATAANVIPVPEDADPMEASALVIAQVGYNTAQRFPESRGRTAMVVGDGLIGQFTAQALEARGFRVLLSGHHDCRLERARVACPALCTANSAAPEFEKRFKDFAGDRVDMAVDSVGAPGTMAECFRRVKPFGHVAVSGYMGGNQTLDVHKAFGGEHTVHFPAGATRDRLLATLALIRQGMIRVAPLVTHKLAGSDFAEACRLLGGKSAEHLGIALAW